MIDQLRSKLIFILFYFITKIMLFSLNLTNILSFGTWQTNFLMEDKGVYVEHKCFLLSV